MSVTKISDFAVGDVNFNAMMSTLNRAYKGQAQITISEYDTDSAPDVKVGSVFDNNGAQYAVSGTDETPTGYSGISVSTTFYLYFDESALAFVYSSTAPTWSDDLQGWYNGNDRAFFSMYKDSGGTLYREKYLLLAKNNVYINGNMNVTGAYRLTALTSISTIGDLYDTLEKYVPEIGDVIVFTGFYNAGGLTYIPNSVRRYDATTLRATTISTDNASPSTAVGADRPFVSSDTTSITSYKLFI